MINKKGNYNAIMITLLVIGFFAVGGFLIYYLATQPSAQQTVSGQTVQQITQATTEGDVATAKVYVSDVSNNDVNTKVAVPVYCLDDTGKFVIDASTSDKSAEISGSTTRGKTLTCYAFNSSFQTVSPVVTPVDAEVVHIVVQGFKVPNNAKIQIYNDQLNTGNNYAVNVTSVGASGTGSMQKIRITNNNTDTIIPLGGLYIDQVTGTNVSTIEIAGSSILSKKSSSFLPSQATATWEKSTKSTAVSARKELWNSVFEIAGETPLFLEENDYVETGAVRVTGDGEGCVSAVATKVDDALAMYGFTKGYYRGTLTQEVKFGHENDASSSAVITPDLTGSIFACIN